jgi:hypothetical protein
MPAIVRLAGSPIAWSALSESEPRRPISGPKVAAKFCGQAHEGRAVRTFNCQGRPKATTALGFAVSVGDEAGRQTG